MRWAALLLLLLGVACKSAKEEHKPPAPTKKTVDPPKLPVDPRYDSGALGAVSFPVSSGSPEARGHFIRGLLALHSFWYDEAQREFEAATKSDPAMIMAYWGVAMSHLKLLWGDDDLGAAKDALKVMSQPVKVTPRERAWLAATVRLLQASDVRTSRQAYAAAMQQVYAQYPDDESATFLAIALLATIRPDDPASEAARKPAAELAAKVFAHNPKHPGAAHYLIHAYDTPELAARALPAARAYASIAPAAFHARHMPAHIFSRLGMWQDAIASCRSAWDASVAAADREHLDANHHDWHSLNWIVELSFEVGHRKNADAALALFAAAVKTGLDGRQRSLYATQVSSYMARTGEWARVDELLAPLAAAAATDSAPAAPVAAGSDARPGDPTTTHCGPAPANSPLELLERLGIAEAHARAAANQHQVAAAKRYVGEIDELRKQLRPALMQGRSPAEQKRGDEAHGRRMAVLLAEAANNDRALLDALRASAADGEREVAGESNPTGLVIEEEIADTLLRLGNAQEARTEYELVLKTHPNRAHALLGLARAAAKAGDKDTARATYAKLAEQWQTADATTPGLAEVRAAAQ